MIWSISSFKEFQMCERKWFLDKKFGSRSLKDDFRREIYLLSQLESIDAWRGKIVDYTISNYIILEFQKRRWVKCDDAIEYARKLSKARYDFAIGEKYKEEDLKKTKLEYEYAALYDLEYLDDKVDLKGKFKKAWEDIEIALKNFLGNTDFINYLKEANYLVAQKTLQFESHGFTIKGVPDLIAFFPNKPPHIFDWKVHHSGTKTYTEQLLVYSQALFNCEPHKDFKEYIKGYSVYDVNLSEYQLLTNSIRNYKVTEDYIERINDYIAGSLEMMRLKKCDCKFEELNIENFERTRNLDNCTNCQFKKICNEN